ncbi:MAG TPA: excinuclease ABC subunit UvrC [bacterium]|nr:excinuclease ABC subunit UvrC [bacterium]
MSRIREKLKKLPLSPGVYIMRGADGGIIYIGKAVSLRKRVSSYFQKKGYVEPKTRAMAADVADLECVPLKSEEEALLLEAKLIREFQPKYNIALRDDKRYPMLRLSMNETFPRFTIVRFPKDDGAEYFGPYTDSTGLKKVVMLIQGIFKLRGCSHPVLQKEHAKHCMYAKIGACLRPCLGEISPEAYRDLIGEAVLIVQGYGARLIGRLKLEMRRRALLHEYEEAAKLRDSIRGLDSVIGSYARNINMYRRIAPDLRRGLDELGRALSLACAPEWIEALDISNISGVMAVGAVAVFRNGVPSTDDYRRFRIKEVEGIDDYRMMQEMVRRRYSRLKEGGGRLPGLILIDGGKGHLSAALSVLDGLGLAGMPVASIAKQNEEVFLPGRDEPVILEKDSPALYLLQHIRDEAHRFAITYHRRIRSKRIKESILDDIPGVGEERKKAILKHFGSIDRLRRKTLEEIAEAPGIPAKLAREIYNYLHR